MKGPITFADFMENALYDPDEGFYSRMPVGEQGHFVTSPHLSPVFGRLAARQVADLWELLGRPDPFHVVEVGAADGTLARQILEALPAETRRTLRYTAVERSQRGRTTIRDGGLDAVASLDEISGPVVGCVLANELLDNLPFHRLRGAPGAPVELFVGVESDRFILVEGPPSSGEVAALCPALPPGREFVVSPAAIEFIHRVGALLERGYVWLVDYGFADQSEARSVHGYRDQRVHDDVLAEPGSTDITAGVDFVALVEHARSEGLQVWGPVSQRDALLALGFRELDERARARQVEALNERRGVDALRIYSNRNRANLLLGRVGAGASWVLGLGKNAAGTPLSFRR